MKLIVTFLLLCTSLFALSFDTTAVSGVSPFCTVQFEQVDGSVLERSFAMPCTVTLDGEILHDWRVEQESGRYTAVTTVDSSDIVVTWQSLHSFEGTITVTIPEPFVSRVTVAFNAPEFLIEEETSRYSHEPGAAVELVSSKGTEKIGEDTLATDERHFGFRNRFWALFFNAREPLRLVAKDLQVTLFPQDTSTTLSLYAGPIESNVIAKPGLSKLMYEHLWGWLTPLAVALQYLVHLYFGLTGSPLIAIILLSVTVKVIMIPFTKLANRWQEEVNQKKSIIEPRIDELKKEFKGEELHYKSVELYKELNISPWYTLKSLFGTAVQIPFFFAAYHALSESIHFMGHELFWMNDLAMPDALVTFGFSIPWFGNSLNLLPFVMTALTILASRLTVEPGLSKDILKKQRRSLYNMAIFFFVILYPFPAVMVLYWTMNNLMSVFSALLHRLGARKSA